MKIQSVRVTEIFHKACYRAKATVTTKTADLLC